MFSLFGRPSVRTAPATRTQLGVESLDRRDLPSVSLTGTTLTIAGGGNEDVVNVDYAEAFVLVKVATYQDGSPLGLGTAIPYTTGQVQKVVFLGLGDDDRFVNRTTIPASVYGGSGDDYVISGDGGDYVSGSTGDDVIYGGKGDDRIYGEAGDDLLRGNDGDDLLYGGAGYDVLSGLGGDDYLDGGADGIADLLHGGTGADTFKYELYITYDPISGAPHLGNTDQPLDFTSADGDQYEYDF